ncbi:hypothetical protein BJ165DRAFT_1616594 [Panaeolus papilionaceus]|nr:hypothetical protein BJ165DRAFT_1616594 [Panaeolus papilionaceus]
MRSGLPHGPHALDWYSAGDTFHSDAHHLACVPLPTNSSRYFVVNNRVMENLELEWLYVTGDISVKPVTRIPDDTAVYIIMGPTGAGKSTFIGALAGGSQNLAISSNQLAGFTQHVTAYKLVNVARRYNDRAIYLVDTPGFSDDKISEFEVMEMLGNWLKENGSASLYRILFLTPIAVTRLPGSRQRTIKMLKELLGVRTYTITVVTTMWNTLHSERICSQAEQNFEQLKAKVFKGFFGEETDLKRFLGTRNSALQVMDIAGGYYDRPFNRSTNTSSTHLYCDLHERIEGALQKKIMFELDLAHSDKQNNKEFEGILEQDQKENDETLAKFISQLVKFARPPPEFREGAQALRKTIVANIIPANHRMHNNFQQWAEDPEIRSGLVSGPKLTKTILAMLAKQQVDDQPSWKLDFNTPFRQLLKSTKIHRPNWLKREE